MMYTPTIGLEVHVQLKTKTKMFCRSKNDPSETEPNVNICPICLGHPGTLPVINKEAVRQVLRIGIAVGGKLADFTEFDRKNYFYPDIPKGYQISQYKYPLVSGGVLNGVALTRIHLEEDTARNIHTDEGASLVDFNRAGVPLMELVTEPVITTAKEASDFARELQLLLRYLEASDAHMEKGEMRIEANVSVGEEGVRGTKVEVKNLNSFRSVERAIEFEIARQKCVPENGVELIQETRGWDEVAEKTVPQRKKESSEDYRYFPEPDLPKLTLSTVPEFSGEVLQETLPELPGARQVRYVSLGIGEEVARNLVTRKEFGNCFDDVTAQTSNTEELLAIAHCLVGDLAGLVGDEGSITSINPEELLAVVRASKSGKLSNQGVRRVLEGLYNREDLLKTLLEKHAQESDKKILEEIIDTIVDAHAGVVEEYKNGKESALQFLIGQAMKESKGTGNPKVFKEILEKKLA